VCQHDDARPKPVLQPASDSRSEVRRLREPKGLIVSFNGAGKLRPKLVMYQAGIMSAEEIRDLQGWWKAHVHAGEMVVTATTHFRVKHNCVNCGAPPEPFGGRCTYCLSEP
jgi:hypothetical protein